MKKKEIRCPSANFKSLWRLKVKTNMLCSSVSMCNDFVLPLKGPFIIHGLSRGEFIIEKQSSLQL